MGAPNPLFWSVNSSPPVILRKFQGFGGIWANSGKFGKFRENSGELSWTQWNSVWRLVWVQWEFLGDFGAMPDSRENLGFGVVSGDLGGQKAFVQTASSWKLVLIVSASLRLLQACFRRFRSAAPVLFFHHPDVTFGDKFGESLVGSQAPPSFWEVPVLPRKFPELPRNFSATSPEVLSLWNLTAIQRFPRSFPNFPEVPRSSPNFPGSSGTSPEVSPFSQGSLTPSPDSQKLSLWSYLDD